MKLDTALYQLKNHTLPFLATHPLVLSGASQSGVLTRYLNFHDAALGGNEGFRLDSFPMQSTYQPIDGVGHRAVQVHNVRMIPSAEDVDVSEIEPYVLDGSGPDLMVTGQLSACVFVIRREPGRMLVAHIQPGGMRQTGAMLKQTIKLMGRLGRYGRATHVFGLGDYNPRAHVVGIRKGGTWQIFAQNVASGAGPVQRAMQIA